MAHSKHKTLFIQVVSNGARRIGIVSRDDIWGALIVAAAFVLYVLLLGVLA